MEYSTFSHIRHDWPLRYNIDKLSYHCWLLYVRVATSRQICRGRREAPPTHDCRVTAERTWPAPSHINYNYNHNYRNSLPLPRSASNYRVNSLRRLLRLMTFRNPGWRDEFCVCSGRDCSRRPTGRLEITSGVHSRWENTSWWIGKYCEDYIDEHTDPDSFSNMLLFIY